MVSILIFNHQRLVREGWSVFLSSMHLPGSSLSQSGVWVAGTTGDHSEACRLAEAMKPGVILAYSDLGMGLVRLQALHAASPFSKIIVVTPFCPTNVLQQVRHLGVRGCLTMDSPLCELEAAIVKVINGRTYLSGTATVAESPAAERFDEDRRMFGALTRRELEVAGLLGAGKTSREVAGELGVSARTVEVHRQRILAKLQCKNTVHLAAKLTKRIFDGCSFADVAEAEEVLSPAYSKSTSVVSGYF